MLPPIILASSSLQRKMLMDALGVSYAIIAADIDEEAIRDDDLGRMAEKLARAKAEKVAKENPKSIVIAADTFVISNGKEFQKPKTKEEARMMLTESSGREIKVLTGFCYLDNINHIDFSNLGEYTALCRKMSRKEIETFVEVFPVTTWSGAFSPAYPYGMTLIASLNGSLTGFMHGLPAELVVENLRKSGYEIIPQRLPAG